MLLETGYKWILHVECGKRAFRKGFPQIAMRQRLSSSFNFLFPVSASLRTNGSVGALLDELLLAVTMKPSGSLKRSKPRVSPLLAPLNRRSSPRPRHGPPQKPTPTLPYETRRQWMLDALEALNATTLSLAVQHDLIDSPQHHRAADVSMIESPSLETPESQAMHLLACYETANSPCSSIPSPKRPPVCAPACSLLPLYVRGNRRRSPTKPPHRLPSKPCGQHTLTLCLSSEVIVYPSRLFARGHLMKLAYHW
jgi:hypothetical protein